MSEIERLERSIVGPGWPVHYRASVQTWPPSDQSQPTGDQPVSHGEGLCTMVDLDVLAGELDEIDAALARMDAAPSDVTPTPSP